MPWVLALLCILGIRCDFLNPGKTDNPRTTIEELAASDDPTKALLPGLRRLFASALSATVLTTEYVSDNVASTDVVHPDYPRDIRSTSFLIGGDGEGTDIYWNLQELRGLCDFVLDEVAPAYAGAEDLDLAEAHYYRGMAYLILGENFVAVPTGVDEIPVKSRQLLERAVADLVEGRRLGFVVPSTAALARASRASGNADAAAQFANEALVAGGTDFLFFQEFDRTSIRNEVAWHLAIQLQTMQPLPPTGLPGPEVFRRGARYSCIEG
ncbi:MAG: hypothetical protein HKN37_02600 [Rhodothermales bacterium]|nr:hypothetical protein [Rhodothermales bacterium]